MLDTISQLVLDGIGGFALLYLVGRVVTGVFFFVWADHKLTNAERRAALVATLWTATSRLFRRCSGLFPGLNSQAASGSRLAC
ncbi:hypothetical protein [Bradyrhizobium canariense]|uniref:hypothetical protein n=1 Tax=Bradyrhizobium canariense TaxID=255045 RepID=UPI0013967541|nr:hypothetical protein [Bradyrhizobium canariense]